MIHKLFRQSSVIIHTAHSARLWQVCYTRMCTLWMFIFCDTFLALQVKRHQWFFKICDLFFIFLVVFLFLLSDWSDSVLPSHARPLHESRMNYFYCRHTFRRNIYSPCTFHNPWSRLDFRKPSYTLNMTGWCFWFCDFVFDLSMNSLIY